MAKKWIQKAVEKMKSKGTVGSFRAYCGGKVTYACIQRGLRSKDPKIRRRAQFALNMMNLRKKEEGGEVIQSHNDIMKRLRNAIEDNLIDYLSDSYIEQFNKLNQKVNEVEELAKALFGGEFFQGGGEAMVSEEEVVNAEQQPAEGQRQQAPKEQITFEQYLQFVLQYPTYLRQLLEYLKANKLI